MDNFTETAELQLNITSNAQAFEALMNSVMQSAVDAATRAEAAWKNVGTGISAGVSPAAMEAKGAMTQVGDTAEGQATRTATAWQAAGYQMQMIGGMLLEPIKQAMDQFVGFDAALHNIAAEGAAGGVALSDLGKQFQQIGEASGESATALATADYKVGAAGYVGAAGTQFMGVAAKAAAADQADLNTTSQALIAIMGAYKNATGSAALGTNDLQKASDLMLATVGGGVMRLDEFSANIAKVAPLAGQMGVGLAQVGAGLDVLTKQGLTATQSANELNAILSALLKPSKDLEQHFRDDGIASGEALIAARGFGGALEYLRTASGGSDEELAHMIPNIRAIKGEISLASGEFGGYNEALAKMDTATQGIGRTQEAFNEQTKSAKFQIDQMKSAMEAAGESAMASLAPALTAIAGAIKGLADWFQGLPGPLQATVVAFTALTGGALVLGGAFAVLQPAIIGIGAALGGLLGPIALVAAGAAIIIANWQGIGDFFGMLGQAIGTAFGQVGSAVGDALKNVWDTITTWVGDTAKKLFDAGVSWVAQLASGIVMAIPNFLGDAANQVGNYIVGMFTAHSDPPAAPGLTAAGASWVAQIGKGMLDSDFGFIDQLGGTLETRFAKILGPDNKFNIAEAVFGTKADIAAVIDAFRTGADNVDQLMAKVSADLQGQGADVRAEVEAYIELQRNINAVNDLETKKVKIEQDWNHELDVAKQGLDDANAKLQTQTDIMQGLKLTEAEQKEALQPYVDAVSDANSKLQDQQNTLSELQDQLNQINDTERERLDVINQQIDAISYSASKEQRGAKRDDQAAARAVRDEERAWEEEKIKLEQQMAAAGGSGTQAGAAIKKQMADEQLQHDARLNQLKLQKDHTDDVLTSMKDKEQDTLQPLQDQAEDIKHSNDAQKNLLTSQIDSQKVVVDNAKTAKNAAQDSLDQQSKGLLLTQQQIRDEQVKIDKLTIEKQGYQENYDAIVKGEAAAVKPIDDQITALKKLQPALVEALAIAKDRVTAEDQVVQKINEQTTAMQKQASAAGSASALAKAEKERVAPIADRVTADKSALDQSKLGATEALAPLQVALDQAKARGDAIGIKEAQARLDSMKATWDAKTSPYQEQYNVDNNLLDQLKNKAITVNDAVSQSDSARIQIHNQLVNAETAGHAAATSMYDDEAKAHDKANQLLAAHEALLLAWDPSPYFTMTDALHNLATSGLSFSQVETLVKPLADKMHLSPDEVKLMYTNALTAGGQLTQGAIDGLKAAFPTLTTQIDIVKNSGLTVADGINSSNPKVAQAAKDISQALIDKANATLGSDSGATSPMYKAGATSLTNLTLGQQSQMSSLSTSSTAVGNTMVDGTTNPLLAAAKANSSLNNAASGMVAGVLDVLRAQVGTAAKGPFYDLGGNVDAGIAGGMAARVHDVADGAAGVVTAALAAAKLAAKTGSPSRLFAEEIGIPIAQGIGVGITEGTPQAIAAVPVIIQRLLDAMKGVTPTLTAQVAADPAMLNKLMSVASETTHRVEHHVTLDSRLTINHEGKVDGVTPELQRQQNEQVQRIVDAGNVVVVQKLRGIFATLWQLYAP